MGLSLPLNFLVYKREYMMGKNLLNNCSEMFNNSCGPQLYKTTYTGWYTSLG